MTKNSATSFSFPLSRTLPTFPPPNSRAMVCHVYEHLQGTVAASAAAQERTRFNVFCEQLEGRQLLSTGTLPVTLGPIDLTYGQTLNQVVNGGLTPAEVNIKGNDVPGTWTFA